MKAREQESPSRTLARASSLGIRTIASAERFQSMQTQTRRTAMKRLAVTVLAGVGAVALMTTGVSAAIICNDEGDCWQSKETYTYPPEARVHVYGDDYVVDTKKYKMREVRPGPGYWRGGVWVGF